MSAFGPLPYSSPGAEWPSLGAWPSPSPEAITVVPGVRCDSRAQPDRRDSKEPEERPPPRAPGGATLGVATDVAVEPLKPRRSSTLKDAPEFTAALAAWRHSFSETPTVGVSDGGGAPTDDVFRV